MRMERGRKKQKNALYMKKEKFLNIKDEKSYFQFV